MINFPFLCVNFKVTSLPQPHYTIIIKKNDPLFQFFFLSCIFRIVHHKLPTTIESNVPNKVHADVQVSFPEMKEGDVLFSVIYSINSKAVITNNY